MGNNYPRVILSSGNITHYHYTGLALQNAGYLFRYLTTFSGMEAYGRIGNLLPKKWQKRLQGKYLPGLDEKLIKTLPQPYVSTRVIHGLGMVSQGRANALFSQWYDRSTLQWVTDAHVFHFVNSMGLCSARKAKKFGSILICDIRTAHIFEEETVLREEHIRLGLRYHSVRNIYKDRLLEEYELADYLVVPSEYVAQTFEQAGISRERIYVVPYGVDLTRFSIPNTNKEYDKNDIFRVIYVGQVIPRKGVHFLLRAFELLDAPNSELLIIGSLSDNAYIEKWLSSNDGRVRFIGHVPQSDLRQLYNQAAVFVLPTLMEGSALVVNEAMAAGLPVITTPNAGSIVRNGIEGFIVPVRNIDSIEEKLLWLYEHPDERLEMGAQARKRVNDFTWDKYGNRLLSAYDDFLKLEDLL